MSATTIPNGSADPATSPPRKLKILMLHGYTQSGPLFHAKTRALEKALQKAFPPTSTTNKKPVPGSLPSYPGGITLLYPSGPLRLSPSDIPGYTPSSETTAAQLSSTDSPNDWRAWWTRDTATGEYVGLNEGLQTIADTIAEAGGIDGVIGFSQGAAGAAFVASLLEEGRIAAFKDKEAEGGIAFPPAFLTSDTETVNNSTPLKFAVSYSGFFSPDKRYRAFYEPKIQTPTLHFIGSLDSVVEEDRSTGLVKSCAVERVVVHPGGHFVPIGKEWVGALIGFIREVCGEEIGKKEEESVEDMDVPF